MKQWKMMNYWIEKKKGINTQILVNVFFVKNPMGKKTDNGIEITSLYERFEAIATFRAICSKFLAKHRHP